MAVSDRRYGVSAVRTSRAVRIAADSHNKKTNTKNIFRLSVSNSNHNNAKSTKKTEDKVAVAAVVVAAAVVEAAAVAAVEEKEERRVVKTRVMTAKRQ